MNRVLVTGASRGLGFALTRRHLDRGDRVFAAVRDPATLHEVAARHPEQLTAVPMDVADAGSIDEAYAHVRRHVDALDVLVNNAGVYSAAGSAEPDERLGRLDADDAVHVLRVNAVGPLLVAERFLGLLRAAPTPKVVTISSCLASVSENTGGFPYYYAASKAAANMYMRTFATDPATAGVVSVLLDPGDIRTAMNDGPAARDAEDVAAAVVALVDQLSPDDDNRFLRWDGPSKPGNGRSDMHIGVNLPHLGASATREAVVRGAEQAERLGYHSVWTLDRLLSPVRPRNPYPGTPDVPEWPSYFERNLDPIDTLTFAAAHTTSIRLGTAVLDIPFYNPVLLARRLTTLDVFSDGRVTAGFGLGYSEDEYEATGTTAGVRGRRADEFLEVLKEVWTADPVTYDGEFFTVPPSTIALKPLQRPHPPVYLAAYVPAALRRVARYADGWLPAGFPLDDLASWTADLRRFAADAGRDPAELKVAAVYLPHLTSHDLGTDRAPLTGSPTQLKDDVARLRDLGVHELVLELKLNRPPDRLLADMEQLREVVG